MEAEAATEVAVSRADEWSGWNGTACPRGDACIVSGSVGVEVSVPQPPSVACGGAACMLAAGAAHAQGQLPLRATEDDAELARGAVPDTTIIEMPK